MPNNGKRKIQRNAKKPQKKWRITNPEKCSISNKLSKLKRKDKSTAQYKIWRSQNLDKLRVKAAKYRKKYPHKVLALNSKRRVQNKLATPSWIDRDLVNDMYKEAAYQQLHVDHIVPLKSAIVCGLHWEGNLQLLTSVENIKKGNRTWPDMW